MKYLIYSKENHDYSAHNIGDIISYKFDPTVDNGSWVFYDNNGRYVSFRKGSMSLFMNSILEYIWIYQKDSNKKIWFYEANVSSKKYNYVNIKIYLEVDIFLEMVKKGKIYKKHVYLIYMLLYTHKKENAHKIDDFNDDWKNVHIANLENNMGIQYGQPVNLEVDLYGYQLKTLNWMVQVEQDNGFKYALSIPLSDLFVNLEAKKKMVDIKFDMLTKELIYKSEVYHKMYINGAILADEMGLGKTITTIALMLTNRMNNNGYSIKNEDGRFNTKANLVICPSHLARQWAREINKSCPLMNVVVCLTKPMHRKLTYRSIIDADVVIVSFQFLTNYKYYLRLKTDNYITITSLSYSYGQENRMKSLLNNLENINKLSLDDQLKETDIFFEYFNWHRLVVDEGHEIFGNMSVHGNTQQYVLGNWIMRVRSKFKWYISGTPFINSHGMKNVLDYIGWLTEYKNSDIGKKGKNGKSMYLKYDGICEKGIYQNFFRESILKKMYYRNTKESVGSEYSVPAIVEEVILLEFTDFERSLYVQNRGNNMEDINNVYLRQLCCHPQVSDRNIFMEDTGLSLEEVRQSLIKHNKDKLCKEKKKLENIKKDPEQHGFSGKVKRVENRIKQFEYMINFFENIEPVITEIENDSCSICLCSFEDLVITECGHFFCKECIQCSLKMSNSNCPICREKLNLKQIHPIEMKDMDKNKIDILVSKYGTKMGKLIGICRKLFNNPENRIIIFSQWDKMLNLISNTLKENDINTVSCKGNVHQRNCAIESFKKGKKGKDVVRVIMLSLENAASGINLTEATHIILMDPIAGSKEKADAIEGQAIGRACRLGQNKPVKVIRLIVKDTIEHELHKRNVENSDIIDVNENIVNNV